MMEFFRLRHCLQHGHLEESAAALAAAGFVDVEIRDRHGCISSWLRRNSPLWKDP